MSEQKIWAEGFYFDRRDGAPDFVIGRIGIDRDRFVAWLEKQPVSDRGYLNINVTRSKDGEKYSASLDTWKPNPERREQPQGKTLGDAYRDARNGVGRAEPELDDEIPF